MADEIQKPSGGITIGKGGEVTASDRAIERIVAGIEHIFDRALDWSGNHPFLFTLILIAVVFGIYMYFQFSIALAAQKREFESARTEAKGQLALPFPKGNMSDQETDK